MQRQAHDSVMWQSTSGFISLLQQLVQAETRYDSLHIVICRPKDMQLARRLRGDRAGVQN